MFCHLTQTPTSLRALAPEVPPSVELLVQKLLAKNPEERDQSTHGLLRDLETCQETLRTTGDVAAFTPGAHDVQGRFQIPQRLYGREAETRSRLATFDEAAEGHARVVMVSGAAGIGKSALVNETHRPIVARRGFFLEGKFDQFRRDTAYAAFIQALAGFARQLLALPDEKLHGWRTALNRALGGSGDVITRLVPELSAVLRTQAPVAALNPAEEENRFQDTLQRFFAVAARRASHGASPKLAFSLTPCTEWGSGGGCEVTRRLPGCRTRAAVLHRVAFIGRSCVARCQRGASAVPARCHAVEPRLPRRSRRAPRDHAVERPRRRMARALLKDLPRRDRRGAARRSRRHEEEHPPGRDAEHPRAALAGGAEGEHPDQVRPPQPPLRPQVTATVGDGVRGPLARRLRAPLEARSLPPPPRIHRKHP